MDLTIALKLSYIVLKCLKSLFLIVALAQSDTVKNYLLSGFTQREIADILGVHERTIGRIVSKLKVDENYEKFNDLSGMLSYNFI